MKKKKPTHGNGTSPRKSMCQCGHSGGAPFSAHNDLVSIKGDLVEAGHGGCLIEGCKCIKFRWKEYVT